MGILSFIVTLFGGILAGIVVTILVVYLINELMDTPKWLIGLMGLFLLFFLSFQFTAIIGAGKVKGVVEDITGLSNTVSGKVDWNNIETTYPVLKPYLDKVGTKVDEVSDQKTSALSLINSIINGFMWRRAAWALGGDGVVDRGLVHVASSEGKYGYGAMSASVLERATDGGCLDFFMRGLGWSYPRCDPRPSMR